MDCFRAISICCIACEVSAVCGRFWIETEDTPEELAALIEEAESRGQGKLPRGEIRPGQQACVLTNSRKGHFGAFPMRWGFSAAGRLTINARSETAGERPMFAQSLRMRRCLIPACAYFEWDHRIRPMPKYRFHVREPFFGLAGLYRVAEDSKAEFVVLTREAEPAIRAFHDRMPVMLPVSMGKEWTDPQSDPHAVMEHAIRDLCWENASGFEQIDAFGIPGISL